MPEQDNHCSEYEPPAGIIKSCPGYKTCPVIKTAESLRDSLTASNPGIDKFLDDLQYEYCNGNPENCPSNSYHKVLARVLDGIASGSLEKVTSTLEEAKSSLWGKMMLEKEARGEQ